MCVKEFLGYNCGHCSIPTLRQCPLSASNPVFPVCKWPAERPMFTNEYCHPCSRVVWNTKVLKEEEEHRGRHLRGECMCEVIFEGEDREKHVRPRGGKGKSKGKGKEIIQGKGESGGYEVGEREVGGFAGHMAEGDPGGYRGHALAVGDSSGFDGGPDGVEDHVGMVAHVGEAGPRQEWEPEAQTAAYEYVGYYVGDDQNQGSQGTDPAGPSYPMTLGAYNHQDQLPMGQAGAGMKWYPYENNYPAPPPTTAYENQGTPKGPRATSEPIGKYNHLGPAEQPVPSQPIVVSSDMMSS